MRYTLAFCFANARQVANPMPELPPVTIAVLPAQKCYYSYRLIAVGSNDMKNKVQEAEIHCRTIDVANLSDQAVSFVPTRTETAAYQDREALLQLLSQLQSVSARVGKPADVQGLAGIGN